MGFEVYKKGSAPTSSVPAVTIQKRGNISLNKAAYKLMGSPEGVELLWDAENRTIGLRGAALTSPNAYPARPQSSNSDRGPYLIAGAMFMRYIGEDVSVARRWVPELVDDILCVNLDREFQVATGPRERAEETGGDSRPLTGAREAQKDDAGDEAHPRLGDT